MFGIAVARLDKITDEEKERYQALYCGLCRAIKERYGQVSRAALSYDLAFMVMLFDSLHEPVEQVGACRCIAHPNKKMPFAMSAWSDYAADLSVALAFHKCLDDVADDGSLVGRAGSVVLSGAYKKACERIPEQCCAIEKAMLEIRELERSGKAGEVEEAKGTKPVPPDVISKVFGKLMGELFSYQQGIWESQLREFGNQLGRFIYLMDAACDLTQDMKSGSYNPLIGMGFTVDELRMILGEPIGKAADIFERLPLIQDVNLMRSVLYSGVWQKFNSEFDNIDA